LNVATAANTLKVITLSLWVKLKPVALRKAHLWFISKVGFLELASWKLKQIATK
jgi:hypothetical protein